MAKIIRYSLATVCLAASIGSLALSWRSAKTPKVCAWDAYSSAERLTLIASNGTCVLFKSPKTNIHAGMTTNEALRAAFIEFTIRKRVIGEFGRYDDAIYFPLWYAALVSALAAVAAIRLGQRFTLRSALITTAIIAALLGMAVAL